MKDESTSRIGPAPTKNKRKKRISRIVCSVIRYVALAVIVLLAIPMCLLIAAIEGVWWLANKIVRAIELAAK